jgi:tetratricopeptide (TPR) repeat protein
MDQNYLDAESWLHKADRNRADNKPSHTVECFGYAIFWLVASSYPQKGAKLASVVADAATFVINQLLKEETIDTEEDPPDFFSNSVDLLMTDGDISKQNIQRLLEANFSEADSINDYIKEILTRKALELLIMTKTWCNKLKALLESRTIWERGSQDTPQSRLHKEIDAHLRSASLLVRGDESFDTKPNKAIDYFLKAYELSKKSGSIQFEALCASRVGTAYKKLNRRWESDKYYRECIRLCFPPEAYLQANLLRYGDMAEFNKAKVDFHKMEWLKEAKEGRVEFVIADDELRDELARQNIAEAARLMHEEAQGTLVEGGLHFVRYLLAEHPPRGQNQDRIDAVQTSLDSHTGRPLKKQLKEVLMPTKFLYHPDRNRGVHLEMKDVEWELLSIEITKALNGFKIPGEKTVRDPPGKGKRKC